MVDVIRTIDSSTLRNIAQLEIFTVLAEEEPPVIPDGRRGEKSNEFNRDLFR